MAEENGYKCQVNSNNKFIRVLSKSNMHVTLFSSFFNKNRIYPYKYVINSTGYNVYNKQMNETDKEIESAQETSVRCKAGLMIRESL